VIAQPRHAARDACVRDPRHGAALLQGLEGFAPCCVYTGEHGVQVFTGPGAVVGKVLRPGVDLAARNVSPRAAFPVAKIHFAQPRVGVAIQIGSQRKQVVRKMLTSL